MAVKSLVTYFTPGLAPIKARVEEIAGTHVLIRVTSISNARYPRRLLMLVPRTSLALR